MRGFHLFATLVGGLLILVSTLFAYYSYSQEKDKMDLFAETQLRYQELQISEAIKKDAFQSVNEVLRRVFEGYFSSTDLYVPRDVLEGRRDEVEWFEETYLRSERFYRLLGEHLVAQLKEYERLEIPGYTVKVEANTVAAGEVVAKNARIIKNPDGTFYFYFDTRELDIDELEKLPKVEICMGEGEACSTVSVFVRGEQFIYIPLRFFRALEDAKSVYKKLSASIGSLSYVFGHCEEKCGDCALYSYTGGKLVRKWPKGNCKVWYYWEEGFEQKYVVQEAMFGGCTSLYINGKYTFEKEPQREEEKFLYDQNVSCDRPKDFLEKYISFKLNRIVQNMKLGNMYVEIVPGSVNEYKTHVVLGQTAISIEKLMQASSIPLDLIFEALGMEDLVQRGGMFIALEPCEFRGYTYCAVPDNLRLRVWWVETDPAYCVSEMQRERLLNLEEFLHGKKKVCTYRFVFSFVDRFKRLRKKYMTIEQKVLSFDEGSLVDENRTYVAFLSEKELEDLKHVDFNKVNYDSLSAVGKIWYKCVENIKEMCLKKPSLATCAKLAIPEWVELECVKRTKEIVNMLKGKEDRMSIETHTFCGEESVNVPVEYSMYWYHLFDRPVSSCCAEPGC